jgi:hypothetical protein
MANIAAAATPFWWITVSRRPGNDPPQARPLLTGDTEISDYPAAAREQLVHYKT